jgi:hypothetical protein
MSRVEGNKIVLAVTNDAVKLKPEGTYEEMVSFQLGVIASMLADISKSLAVIADKTESEENNV